jgi:hypothetical protein
VEDAEGRHLELKTMRLQPEILIRERAYAIWEQEGRPEGREWEHWFRAAGEIQPGAAASSAAQQDVGRRRRKDATGRIRKMLGS